MPSERESDETWSIPDVFHLTDGTDGRIAIPRLRLDVLASGIKLVKEDGDVAWSSRWSNLDELSIGEHAALPDGREGLVVVAVEHGGRRHRFVLPADEPASLSQQVRATAKAHRVRTVEPRSPVVRTLTVAVVLATMATLSVLLLSAAHVIHF